MPKFVITRSDASVNVPAEIQYPKVDDPSFWGASPVMVSTWDIKKWAYRDSLLYPKMLPTVLFTLGFPKGRGTTQSYGYFT